MKYYWNRLILNKEELGAGRLGRGKPWPKQGLGFSLELELVNAKSPRLAASPAEPWVSPIVPFPLFHPPNEQRLGPTPAESAREGARHPSGLPQGWPRTHPCQAGRTPGWDHRSSLSLAPLDVKAGVRSSQNVN